MRRLFPDVPDGHPALGAIVMNLAANMLGLTNAATPLGLRAMKELEELNPLPGTATNAMCTFLAINTSSVQLIPVTAIAVMAAAGSRQPTAILGTALLATLCSTVAGIAAVKTFERWRIFRVPGAIDRAGAGIPRPTGESGGSGGALADGGVAAPMPSWGKGVLVLLVAVFAWFLVKLVGAETGGELAGSSVVVKGVNAVSLLAIPFLLVFFPVCAALRGVAVYEEFVEGAKEGFSVGVRLIPYLVAMLVAIGVFRGAGGIDWLGRLLGPALEALGFPVELLPMSLVRPLSGSATLGLLTDLVRGWAGRYLGARRRRST
jgi:spore maturation protein SpmA